MRQGSKPLRARLAGAAAVLGLVTASLATVAPTTAAAPPPTSDGIQYRVLVFTKAAAEQHASTAAGVAAIRELGETYRFSVQVTNDARKIEENTLDKYRAVVFLNTSGDVLNAAQQAAFEDYFFDGGGFVGIHSAIETEPDWGFLTDIIGTRASGTSPVTEATIKVADRVHIASEDLPEYWQRTDQWYNFTSNVRGRQHVLATVDESTYAGGTMGFDHPITWCQDYKGGRSFYTAGGDTRRPSPSRSSAAIWPERSSGPRELATVTAARPSPPTTSSRRSPRSPISTSRSASTSSRTAASSRPTVVAVCGCTTRSPTRPR